MKRSAVTTAFQLVLMALSTACAMHRPCRGDFDAPSVERMAKPAVVRLVTDKGGGTAFVVEQPNKDEILFATSYHVVSFGDSFTAEFKGGASLANLEVVETDVKNDLVLLKAHKFGFGDVPGLSLSSRPLRVGEKVAAVGYPSVGEGAKSTFTFEPGDVTSLDQVAAGRTYVQTNANFNPGNSGGPVVNACGQVVGVVQAVRAQTARVGLLVPADHLKALLIEHARPRPAPEVEIQQQVARLQQSISFGQWSEATDVLSRPLLRRVWAEYKTAVDAKFSQTISAIDSYLREHPTYINTQTGEIVTSFSKLRPEEQHAELQKRNPAEYELYKWVYLARHGRVDEHRVMALYVGHWILGVFGETPELQVKGVEVQGQVAFSNVVVKTAEGEKFYNTAWRYDWGAWRMEGFKCVRPARLCPAPPQTTRGS